MSTGLLSKHRPRPSADGMSVACIPRGVTAKYKNTGVSKAMKIVKLDGDKTFTKVPILEEPQEGCSLQLFRSADGYSLCLSTPSVSACLLRNVKRLSTVNNQAARYSVRFEPGV